MHRVEWSAAAHEDVSALFDYVAEVYRITVERGDGIACSDMEAKTAMSLLCIEMVTNGLKKSRPKRSKKTSKEVE